ncbi:MAG: DUF1579 family protein [Pseudomonadota bacterium]
MSNILVSLAAALYVGMLAMEPAAAESAAHSPANARLDALVGEWKTAIKVWDNPDGEPVSLKGQTTRQWVLGGRFIEERSENDTSREGRFQSIAYLGFDKETRLYERFWMTNTATRIFVERGRYDPENNLFLLQGSETSKDGAVISTTSELKVSSPDRHIFTAYVTGASGLRWKQLEIVYSRK